MRIFPIAILCLLFAIQSSTAQSREIRSNLEGAFTHYQNAFNNANQSLKTTVDAFKKSSSVKDARYYATMAGKYAAAAKLYAENAEGDAKKATKAATAISCDKGVDKLQTMGTGFDAAKNDFLLAESELTNASLEEELDVISEHLAKAVEILQGAVQKLNGAVEQMNSAITEMKACS